jgi:hypothetical protein
VNGLTFTADGARPKRHAASPAIRFDLNVACDAPVEALVLRAEVRIEPQWREYSREEQLLLGDIFGAPERWGTTLRSLAWADVPVVIGAFEDVAQTHVDVPCSYDFESTATRLLHALHEGELQVRFLFSGTIFTAGPAGFSCERVPWSAEALCRLPVRTWRDAMRACYGEYALLRVHRETLERLHAMRASCGALSWDELFDRLSGVVT